MRPGQSARGGIAGIISGLLSSTTFNNAPWTGSVNIKRFQGPWLFAPAEGGITAGFNPISNSLQAPVYDTRIDVLIDGAIHLSPPNTPLSGALSINGARKLVFRRYAITGVGAGKLGITKMAHHAHVEGIYGDFKDNPTDQDGLFMGGAGGALITGSISGNYMQVTGRAPVTYNGRTSDLSGDVIIGATLLNGTGVTNGTLVLDMGKCNAIGSISGTTMTTTSEVGAPIVPAPGNPVDGMVVMVDGGIEVGRVTGGASPNWTITNSGNVSVPAGSRIFVESRGGRGSYLVDTSHAPTGNITFDMLPPKPSFYGVPLDVPADRVDDVAASYGPCITRESNLLINTHGSGLCKWIQASNPAGGLNQGALASVQMTGAQTCRVTLGGPLQANVTSRGAWATGTVYAVGDFVTQGGRTYVCRAAHTASSAFTTDRYTRWYPSGASIAGLHPMGAWATGTAYIRGDAVTQGGVMYVCKSDHTASAAFATDQSSRWTNMAGGTSTGFQIKLTGTGYNTGSVVEKPSIGWFNRDWHVNAVIATGSGGAGTVIDLVCASAYTGNLPPNGATADVSTGFLILMGCPYDATTANYGKAQGEHADSLGQMDIGKFAAFLGTDLTYATSDYQSGGITSNSQIADVVEETSRGFYEGVLGLAPGPDVSTNQIWSGMQLFPVLKRKRYFQTYVGAGARPWKDYASLPFPNPGLTASNTELTYTSGTDVATGKRYFAYGGPIYSGGWLENAPAEIFVTAANTGWNYDTSGTNGYSGQRTPTASEMLSMSFLHDTVDTPIGASAGTHIGWFDLTCSATFPGALADGSRCIVDPVPNVNFVGVGRPVSTRRAIRGRQAVPLGNNPVYIDCTIRGTAITKRFGPFNFIGAPAAATTTLTIASQTVAAPNTSGTASARTWTAHPIGAAASDRYVFVAAIMHSSAGTPRSINSVTVGGIAAALVNFSNAQKSDGGTVAIGWYRALVPTGTTADIVVTASGSNSAAMIYVWAVNGLGAVYDASAVVGATGTASVGLSTTIATPPGGAVLAVHTYSNLASGGNRRASAMEWTGYTPNQAQVISGTVASSDLAWNVGTEVAGGDVNVLTAGTGAATLSAIAIGPAIALDANFIAGSLPTQNNVIQPSVATRVSAAGVVGSPGTRRNLAYPSQEFDVAGWGKTGGSTVAANTAIAPNGTLTADTWSRATTGSNFMTKLVVKPGTPQTLTFSIFVKKGSARYFSMRVQGLYPARSDVTFDLDTGLVSRGPTVNTFTNASASITPLADGWYRCTLTSTTDPDTSCQTLVSFSTSNVEIDGSSASAVADGYLWGAQLEEAAEPSGYIPTTTAAVTNTLPRFGYDAGILRGLLVEPARMNLVRASGTFTTGWSVNNFSLVTGNVAPDGTLGGLLATFGASNYAVCPASVVPNTPYTASVFVKWVAGTPRINLGCGKTDSTNGGLATFDVTSSGVSLSSTGARGPGTFIGYTITPIANGWFRLTCTGYGTDVSGGIAITAAAVGTQLLLWGAQVEQGSEASSYIPTTTAAVTRPADTLNLTGLAKANGTYTVRCWHAGGDYTDVAGVTITSGAASLSGVSVKPIQGVTFL